MSATHNSDQSSNRSTSPGGRKADETFTNVGESPASELEEYWSDNEIQPADDTRTETCCFSSGGEDSSRLHSDVSLPRKCLQLREIKRIAVPPAKHASRICAVKSGHVQERPRGSEASVNDDTKEWAMNSCTPLVNRQSQSKPRSSGSSLDGSWLPFARSSSVATADHSRTREDKRVRSASYVHTSADVTAYDSSCRNTTIRTKTSDSELPDHLADSTASNRKRNKTAEKSSSLIANASFLSVRSRSCSCACHTRPAVELPKHDAGNRNQPSTVTIDTRISSTSGDSRAVAKGKEGREERHTLNGRMTSCRCPAYSETSRDADHDSNHDEGWRSMQRLKSAMTNRKREELQLQKERRRLAALTIQKELLMQRLAIESLQNTADMLGSRVSDDIRTAVQQTNGSHFREGWKKFSLLHQSMI